VSLCLGSKVHNELHVSAFLIAWAAARADFAAAQPLGNNPRVAGCQLRASGHCTAGRSWRCMTVCQHTLHSPVTQTTLPPATLRRGARADDRENTVHFADAEVRSGVGAYLLTFIIVLLSALL